MLGMSLFDMGLSKWEVKALRNVCYLTVLFENIPQFAMNIIFFYVHGFTFNFILISALISSFVNILTFVFGSLTRALYQTPGIRFRLAVTIDRVNTDAYTKEIRNIIENVGYRHRLAKKLALALRCRTEQIEVPFVIAMQDGCEIECLYDPDEIVKTPLDLEKLLTFQLATLSMHNAIKDAFRLDRLPVDMKAVHLEFTNEYMNHLPSGVSSDKNATYVEQVVSISKPDLLATVSSASLSSVQPSPNQVHIVASSSPLSLAMSASASLSSASNNEHVNLALPQRALATHQTGNSNYNNNNYNNINNNNNGINTLQALASASVSREQSPVVGAMAANGGAQRFTGAGGLPKTQQYHQHQHRPPPRNVGSRRKEQAPPRPPPKRSGEGESIGNAVVSRQQFRLPSIGNANQAKEISNQYNGGENNNAAYGDDSDGDNSDSEVLFAVEAPTEGNDGWKTGNCAKNGQTPLYTRGNGNGSGKQGTTKGRWGRK